MAKFNNLTVIEKFVSSNENSKGIESHTGNLWVSQDGKRLMNYTTCLVEKDMDNNIWIFNETKYSSTTSKIQTYIRRELAIYYSVNRVKELRGIHQGTSMLKGVVQHV